ncbi:unnamed protein product [Caenorhabditis bovis]|uniref:Lipoprotein n=1 Tax=Caenorhabditis bovis TaxID=2654633 RepID=A0A8S1EWJ8_9PELO|nr:unnamed protein product [Caenorhabditis bovis]
MRITVLLLLAPLSFVSACDIKATLESETYHDVWVKATFFNDTVQTYKLTEEQPKKQLHIKGLFCNLKPTIFEVFPDKPPKPGQKSEKSTQAFIEGAGFINYVVLNDGIFMGMRTGVACAAGDCGASRG